MSRITRWSAALAMLAGAMFAPSDSGLGGAAPAAASPAAPSEARQKTYADIEATFGFVPGFLETLPDASLELEWRTLKAVQMEPGAIPNKYRELIGLAVAAARGCEYCTYFHTQFARLNGATDAELEDAVHYAKSNLGWSTYLHGMRYDHDRFRKDVDRICEHARAQASAAPAGAGSE
jgi:AhpD family alkylhydroperoxidase